MAWLMYTSFSFLLVTARVSFDVGDGFAGMHLDDKVQNSLLGNSVEKQVSDLKTVWRRTSSTVVAENVCFGAKSDSYSTFTLVHEANHITLEYESGHVTCCEIGCDECLLDNWGSNRGRINVWIARGKGDLVAPYKGAQADISRTSHYFYYPGEGSSCINSTKSSLLTFQDDFPAGEYQIWYGQDLVDEAEHDNAGTACVRVLAGDTPTCSHDLTVSSQFPQELGGFEFFRTRNVQFSVLTTIPGDKDGCLFEAGALGRGAFLGIVFKYSSYYLRFTAGDGGSVGDISDVDSAVIMIQLPDPRVPTDGDIHNLTWQINLTSHSIRLDIDGQSFTASSSAAFPCGQWSGGDPAGFGQGYSGVAQGGTMLPWPGIVQGALKAHGSSNALPFTDACAREVPWGCCYSEEDCFAQPGCPGSAGVHCDSDDGSFRCERADWDPICNGKPDGHSLSDGSWCYNKGRRYRHCQREVDVCPSASEDFEWVYAFAIGSAVIIVIFGIILTVCCIFACWYYKRCCWEQHHAQTTIQMQSAVVVGQPVQAGSQPTTCVANTKSSL